MAHFHIQVPTMRGKGVSWGTLAMQFDARGVCEVPDLGNNRLGVEGFRAHQARRNVAVTVTFVPDAPESPASEPQRPVDALAAPESDPVPAFVGDEPTQIDEETLNEVPALAPPTSAPQDETPPPRAAEEVKHGAPHQGNLPARRPARGGGSVESARVRRGSRN